MTAVEDYFKILKIVGVWLSPARALPWGGRGRWFKSSHTDHKKLLFYQEGLFAFGKEEQSIPLFFFLRPPMPTRFLDPFKKTFVENPIFSCIIPKSRNFFRPIGLYP